MFTKIFPIVNIESAFCHWKIDPSGNIKASHIGGVKKPLGICSAMLMVWFKKSIASYGEIKSAVDLGSQHLMAIVNSSLFKKTMYGREYGMKEVNSLREAVSVLLASQGLRAVSPHIQLSTGFNPVQATAYVARSKGYCIIVLKHKDGGYHTLGGRSENGVYDFFDPNFGLFRSHDEPSFLKGMVEHLNNHYYLNNGFATGFGMISGVSMCE
ncbi:YopT-type cysteine protease domain-containing protein [Endozoicomonas gorgoniicola]|uniref:YopT-type cysteine protease domain-containing protein n=1 Tax=Endozoicomonas gorgoniicola TaxID=1234144 RepID=A0ABT3N2T9_9GAMM|nr:YopT-type cysteine protease domain-containing protein [Endozoicomonas gorgoniicola]MCW7555936.1 YopT-type cysteine protease domain-containing protein [Endozoicomonas gorgoniicola]